MCPSCRTQQSMPQPSTAPSGQRAASGGSHYQTLRWCGCPRRTRRGSSAAAHPPCPPWAPWFKAAGTAAAPPQLLPPHCLPPRGLTPPLLLALALLGAPQTTSDPLRTELINGSIFEFRRRPLWHATNCATVRSETQRLHRSSWAHQHRAVQAGGTGGRGGAQLRRCVPPRWSEASGPCTQSCQRNHLEISTFVSIPSLSLPTRCIHHPLIPAPTRTPRCRLRPSCRCCYLAARCTPPLDAAPAAPHAPIGPSKTQILTERFPRVAGRGRFTTAAYQTDGVQVERAPAPRAKRNCATPATSLSSPSPLYRSIFKMAALQASTQRPVCAASRPAAAIAPLKGASVAAQTSQGVTAVRIRGQNWLCPPSGGSAHLLTLTCMA